MVFSKNAENLILCQEVLARTVGINKFLGQLYASSLFFLPLSSSELCIAESLKADTDRSCG